MKVIYLAGPITAPNAWERERNIRRAEEISLDVWLTRLAVPICVHTASRFFDDTMEHQAWMEGDFELIRRADAVIMLPGWRQSKGSMMEYELARSLGKHVFIWHIGPRTTTMAIENDDNTTSHYSLQDWLDGRALPAAA